MAQTYYSQEYPLGTPSVSGNQLTVDLMLKEPTRINSYLSDLALKNYFAERIFANGGGVTGGALVYSQLTSNDLFPARGGQKVAPGAEFPEVTFDRPEPKTAQVEKFGGKFRVTDEARDRNDLSQIQTESIKLANDIQRWLHARALTELEASISAVGSDVQIAVSSSASWADATTLTISTENKAALPAATLAKVRQRGQTQELGADYNLLVLNPQEFANLSIIYGDAEAWLRAQGFASAVSNAVTAGTAYAVAEGQVGQVRYEQALKTVTYREDSTESTVVQTSIRPVFAVTNPYNVIKLTGLAD